MVVPELKYFSKTDLFLHWAVYDPVSSPNYSMTGVVDDVLVHIIVGKKLVTLSRKEAFVVPVLVMKLYS